MNNVDNELVFRLRDDDVNAFNALYWKYHQAVYANIFKLTKETETTQDLLQEVFITLWEKRSTIDVDQSVSGWLFVVSYNKSVSYLKKALKEPVVDNELNEELQPAEEPEINVREVRFQLLEDAVEQLSPQKKRVFELCKLQGKSYEETAKELNISKHTVKEYLSAAITNVKEYIRKHPDYLISFFCPYLLSRFLS
ncbi:MAG: sigma-70 family RNA polymerase sigma factor [Flavisolibacter sp.]|nr:sigma-70 family RNA polymerase sigma factor [Flavisolibacter sp.]